MKKLTVLTWNVHGNYLYYLSQANLNLLVPFKEKEEGYSKLSSSFDWGKNVRQIPASDVKNFDFDLVLFQTKKNYSIDQFEVLSENQRVLPKVFLEHEPPKNSPTDESHPITDHKTTLVHVTYFNKLMWHNGQIQTKVIRHGVIVPEKNPYQGDVKKGIVVINNLKKRGRRLGLDIFLKVRKEVPLDLIGTGSEELGGLGDIPFRNLRDKVATYRFFFNPIRYSSLGLAVCEAMAWGSPVVAFPTTEIAAVIRNGANGFSDTNVDVLIEKMKLLLKDVNLAKKLGEQARRDAQKKFSIQRFTREWEEVLRRTSMPMKGGIYEKKNSIYF